MSDFYELDFLDVESSKSGDAIPLRYSLNGVTYIHVVDGGYQATGDSLVSHINRWYGYPSAIDNVVLTHPDGDHAGGLRTVLESFVVRALWMHRPWLYAAEIIHRFSRFTSVEGLQKRLKELYPNVKALEDIALARGIPIYEPFQGAMIGSFRVMAPSKARYLDLVVESDRTPETVEEAATTAASSFLGEIALLAKSMVTLVQAAWGVETFSPRDTSSENEMSVVQYAYLNGDKILLTGDAGRGALREVIDYAPQAGLALPGIDRFQVPHHGSRRNVSTALLDELLGPKLSSPWGNFDAIISSAKADTHHPRKSVVRAMIHRGGNTYATEGQSISFFRKAPTRGWGGLTPMLYPDEEEE